MSSSGKPHHDGGIQPATGPKDSEAEHLVAVAHEVLAETPDIRTEKLKALKRQLDTGTYHPDEGAVAEGVIREYPGEARALGPSGLKRRQRKPPHPVRAPTEDGPGLGAQVPIPARNGNSRRRR